MIIEIGRWINRVIVTLFFFVLVFVLSCSKNNTDILTNTTWGNNDGIEISFSTETQLTFNVDNNVKWIGVYVLYENNSVLLYKAVVGESDNYILEYTGVVKGNTMELFKDDSVLILKKMI